MLHFSLEALNVCTSSVLICVEREEKIDPKFISNRSAKSFSNDTKFGSRIAHSISKNLYWSAQAELSNRLFPFRGGVHVSVSEKGFPRFSRFDYRTYRETLGIRLRNSANYCISIFYLLNVIHLIHHAGKSFFPGVFALRRM